MNEQIELLTAALVAEFYSLHQRYAPDGIYACALVLSPYLLIEGLAISTSRSLFSDSEEAIQYLSEHDKWQVTKWRYRSHGIKSQFATLNHTLGQYFKQTHMFGQPVEPADLGLAKNNLSLLLGALAQAKSQLIQNGITLNDILFFIHIPNQPKIEVLTAQQLNPSATLLSEMLLHKHYQPNASTFQTAAAKIQLSQSDKDLLTDLEQILMVEPYDYLHVAHQAYLLTLEPSFVDTNVYIQRLIQNIAAMDAQQDGLCEIPRDVLLAQIEQTAGLKTTMPRTPRRLN